MQNKILVVDGDTRSLRLLEVSLAQIGYRVVTATSGIDALSQLDIEVPELVLADTDIGAVDGFALYRKMQARPEWAHIPFIFILDGEKPADKLRAVQLGASDFLTKPVFLKEALSRVELLLEKHAQRGDGGLGAALSSGRARFAGALSGPALLDLLQTMELGRKSGIAYCVSGRGQRAAIYFADGVVVDAELGKLRGEEALYRVLTFQGGEYRVELLTVVRPRLIELETAGLLMEAMRYLEEWNRLVATLPPLTTALVTAALAGNAGALRPEHLPGELREVLQCFDGQRSVLEVLDVLDEEAEPPHDALRRLAAVAKLYAARLLVPAGRPNTGELRAPGPTVIAGPRLTPPPIRPPAPAPPRLTPPPFAASRAVAPPTGAARPTPVALPRAVVFTPTPFAASAVAAPAASFAAAEHRQPAGIPTGAGASEFYTSPATSVDEETDINSISSEFQAILAANTDISTGPISISSEFQARPLDRPADKTDPSAMPHQQFAARPAASSVSAGLSDEYPTPLPRHYPANARQTPVELMPVLPTARLTPPPIARGRLTPPPIARGRLTPPPIPGHGLRSTPPMLQPEAPTMSRPGADVPQSVAMRPQRSTPPTLQPATPVTSPAESDSMMPALSVSDSMMVPMLQGSDAMVAPLSGNPRRGTSSALAVVAPPPPSEQPRQNSEAARDSNDWADPSVSTDTWVDPSASSPGSNLVRLAQRLAASRQPLPFTPPPNFTSGGGTGSAEPSFGSAAMWTGGGDGGTATAPAAAVSWAGSAPELEPISIPDLEAAVEHSVPTWGHAASGPRDSAAPQLLKPEKTSSGHSRSQRIAADDSRAAVHLSAPIRMPAEIASTELQPIGFDAAPPARRPGAALPPAAAPRQRLGKAIAWLAVGAAVFGLGAGLFWFRDSAAPSAPKTGAVAIAPSVQEPRAQDPSPSPTVTAGIEEPSAPPAPAPHATISPPAPSATAPTAGVASAPPASAAPSATHPTAGVASAPPAPAAPIAKPLNIVVPSASPSPSAAPAATATNRVAASPTPATSKAASSSPPAIVAPSVTSPAAPPPSPPRPTVVAQNTVPPEPASAASSAAASPTAEGDYTALITKARSFERRGVFSQAHRAVKEAQRLNPGGAEVAVLLSQLALDDGNADKAANLAQRALLIDPGSADAYLVLGTVEQARNHGEKARNYFRKYLTLAPDGERARDVRAVLHMGH